MVVQMVKWILMLTVFCIVGCGTKHDHRPDPSPSISNPKPPVPPSPPAPRVNCAEYWFSIYMRSSMEKDGALPADMSTYDKRTYRSAQITEMLDSGGTFFVDGKMTPEIEGRFLKIYNSIVDENGDLRPEVKYPGSEQCN